MPLPDFSFQVLRLTEQFFEAYPPGKYPEIMDKKKRSYNCLLIQTHYNFFICIPYRTEIKHKYAYHFYYSERSKKHYSGLDYTKMVIIKNPIYISTNHSVIDKDEYVETQRNIYIKL